MHGRAGVTHVYRTAMTPGTLVGKYRLTSLIGRGSMGEVWSAVNVDTDRKVALKFITTPDPEHIRRLQREAKAIGRLEHPNIVEILDKGETPHGEPFLVMPLLRGETLADRLKRERTLPQAVAAGIALDIARALRVAHDNEIVHRDLKPANIFLHREEDADDAVVKVVDFGVSKLTVENDGGATLNGSMLGSPAYMSPDQVRCVGVDGRSDIWALGVILFEMLTGKRPFAGPGQPAVLTQILYQPVPRLETVAPHIKPGLAQVVAGCLERERDKGIANAAELGRLLRPFATHGRHATVEQAAARERYASIPEPPQPVAAPAEEKPPQRESDAATGLFRPSMILGTSRALEQLREQETGTVLIGGTAAARQGAKPVAETDAPSVDESERQTAEIVGPVGPAAPLPVPRAPPPPRPPPPTPPGFGSGSWPQAVAPPAAPSGSGSGPRQIPVAQIPQRPPASAPEPRVVVSGAVAPPSTGSPFNPPSQPHAPNVTQAQPAPAADRRALRGTQRMIGPPAPPPPAPPPSAPEPELSYAERQRLYKRTLPLSPDLALPPPPPEEVDYRGGTLKVEPGALPSSPAAGRNLWQPLSKASETTTTTAPLAAPPAPAPAPWRVDDAPPARRWPFVLLAASIIMLLGVATLLVVALREDDGRPAPAAPAESAVPATSASSTADSVPTEGASSTSTTEPMTTASAAPPKRPSPSRPGTAPFRPAPSAPF
jgi:serine/threonine-protein kinase